MYINIIYYSYKYFADGILDGDSGVLEYIGK